VARKRSHGQSSKSKQSLDAVNPFAKISLNTVAGVGTAVAGVGTAVMPSRHAITSCHHVMPSRHAITGILPDRCSAKSRDFSSGSLKPDSTQQGKQTGPQLGPILQLKRLALPTV
jgi:hypothetical protein